MLKLTVSDLRDSLVSWSGLFLTALLCGFVSGLAIVLISSAANAGTDEMRQLRNAGSAMLAMIWIAALPVAASTSRLVEKKKEPTYSMWRLLGLRGWQVGASFAIQLSIIAMCGVFLGAFSFLAVVFPLSSFLNLESISFDFTVAFPVLLLEAIAFLLGGLWGVVASLRALPLDTLRNGDVSGRERRVSPFQIAICIAAILLISVVLSQIDRSNADSLVSCLVFVPFLVAILASQLSGYFSFLSLNAWSALVSRRDNALFLIAYNRVRYRVDESKAIHLPVVLAIALLSGLLMVVDTVVSFLRNEGLNAEGMDIGQLVSFLGAPLLICIVGASAVVVMSHAERCSDFRILASLGASRAALFGVTLSEAFIYSFNALLIGLLFGVLSGSIASVVCSSVLVVWPSLAYAIVVAAFLFFLIAVPMLFSLRRLGGRAN